MDATSVEHGIRRLWQKHKFATDGRTTYNSDPVFNSIISIPWSNLTRAQFIEQFSKILQSHFFVLLFKGDFSFLSELITKHNISFEDLRESEAKPFEIPSDEKSPKSIYADILDFLKTISGYRLFFGK